MRVVMPRVRIGSGVLCCPAPLHVTPPCLRVRCHSIVGLVWCLCDRVVSLWNSGDGLVWCLFTAVCDVRFSVVVSTVCLSLC